MKYLMLGAAALAITACSQEATSEAESVQQATEEAVTPVDEMDSDVVEMTASEKLDAVLAAQPDETKARYQYRHPKETLEFFGVEPGMTVVDTLPGEPGWYGKILTPYLGADGVLIGAEYSIDMWSKFGGRYSSEEHLEDRRGFPEMYVASVDAIGDGGAQAKAFMYGSLPDELKGTADVVLMVRAAHHFNRLEDGVFFTEALGDAMDVLKPGGILGVVQHRAPEDAPDEWAVGNAGYVKQSQIVSVFEAAGFELVAESEINANPNDQPTTDDFVWRLPPSNPENAEIGESDRMTLKFRKPE